MYYKLVLSSFLFLLLIDELLFFIYNISFYQLLCGLDFYNYSFSHILNINAFVFGFSNNFQIFPWLLYDLPILYNNDIPVFEVAYNYNLYSNNIFIVYFDCMVNKKHLINFYVLQNKLYIFPGETTLGFFRVYNLSSEAISAFTLYVITPLEYTIFVSKIQCFCFEEIIFYPKELIDLPILFLLDPDILGDSTPILLRELCIQYLIIF